MGKGKTGLKVAEAYAQPRMGSNMWIEDFLKRNPYK